MLKRIRAALRPAAPTLTEPASGGWQATTREAGYPYSMEAQARLGRAASYYLLYRHGRNGGLMGACSALADYEERIAGLQAELARCRGGR